jgi:outer membrane murein-binding lipoprotein Lpp
MEPIKKTPKSKKKIILIVAGIALLAGCPTGAYLWHSQVKELKANRDSNQQKIEELEKKLEGANQADGSAITRSTEPTDKDVSEINKTLTALCSPPDRFDPVTLSDLNYQGSEDKDRIYYNGFAVIELSCTGPNREGVMGYYVILKRQPDGTWNKISEGDSITECSDLIKLKVPHQVYRHCKSGEDFIPNPN